MRVGRQPRDRDQAFRAFFEMAEPKLRQALVASYGPIDGREATIDALSWAWEHWAQVAEMSNPTAYLYRVGQSAIRRFGTRKLPLAGVCSDIVDAADVTPELLPSLLRLSTQQRTVVVLVHGYGWSKTDVAGLLEITPSTVREHLARALERLRRDLEVVDVD